MSKIKEVSSFDGSAWGTAVPLGANDSNVDITSSTTNTADSTATLAGLDDTNVAVVSGDTDASAWTKFNKFRKRVKNVFGNYVTTSLVANAYKASPSSGEVYSAGVLNNYMANVIGISGTSTATVAGSTQTMLSAINSLQYNNIISKHEDLTASNSSPCVTFNPSNLSYLQLTRGAFDALIFTKKVSLSIINIHGWLKLVALVAVISNPDPSSSDWTISTGNPLFQFNSINVTQFDSRIPSQYKIILEPEPFSSSQKIHDFPTGVTAISVPQNDLYWDSRGQVRPLQYNNTTHQLNTLSQITNLYIENNKSYLRIEISAPISNQSFSI